MALTHLREPVIRKVTQELLIYPYCFLANTAWSGLDCCSANSGYTHASISSLEIGGGDKSFMEL